MSDADLIDRLRHAHEHSQQRINGSDIFKAAADRIEALAGEVERLRRNQLEIRRDGDDYLICEGHHHVDEPCEFIRYSENTSAAVDIFELRILARIAWNNWPDTEQSRQTLASHEAKDDVSRIAWDRVVAAILAAARPASGLDASHNSGERLPSSDAAEREAGHLPKTRAESAARALAEAVGIMRPFAGLYDQIDDRDDDPNSDVFFQHDGTIITFGQIRAARDFITAQEKEKV